MTNCKPCDSADPLLGPHYTHPCSEVTEDHARHMIVHQYVATLKIQNQWAVPNNDSLMILKLPAVTDILVGCCLWNPLFGYFKVVSFDKDLQKVGIMRKDVASTAAPGTTVPTCTKFIVVDDR